MFFFKFPVWGCAQDYSGAGRVCAVGVIHVLGEGSKGWGVSVCFGKSLQLCLDDTWCYIFQFQSSLLCQILVKLIINKSARQKC